MEYVAFFTVVLLATLCNAQPQPQPQPQQPQQAPGQQPGPGGNPCAEAGRNAVTQCFLSNGGYNMATVIALISNGTQAQLPPNADQIRSRICDVQRNIITCIFQNIRTFNNSQQCKTVSQFIRLEQETVGLVNGLQQMCGTGLLPKMTPCMSRLNMNMRQCYSKAGLNPNLFAPGSSQMQGAVIGDNREIAELFCSNRKKLFECHNTVLDECPNAKQLQALSGYDQHSMQEGINVLCQYIDVYVHGLVCFQSPTQQVQTCADSMFRSMTDLTVEQLQDNLSLDQFYTKYCRLRMDNLDCDFTAWKSQCPESAVGLKNEFQCNLLPGRCKNHPGLAVHMKKTCSDEHFSRPSRLTGAATPSGGVSSLVLAILSAAAVVLF